METQGRDKRNNKQKDGRGKVTMPGTGFKSVGIKEEVYKELKERAKEEKKSISVYLVELLEREGKTKGKESILSKVFKGNGLTKEDLRGLKEDIQAKAYAGAKEAINDVMNTR